MKWPGELLIEKDLLLLRFQVSVDAVPNGVVNRIMERFWSIFRGRLSVCIPALVSVDSPS